MTAYLRHGLHVFECNARTRDDQQCERVVWFDSHSYSTGQAVAALSLTGWKTVELVTRDGGVHCCPVHAHHWE